MTALLDELDQIKSINGSHTTSPSITTMPSHFNVRNPMGRAHLPHPRPTVSLDPRPVVIPILSSVIGFPILVFALICALRHRAIKLRRRDHLKKLQSGGRSVTLDIPAREKISFFSGGSSPEASMRELACDRLEVSPAATFSNIHTTPTGQPQGILQTKRTNSASSTRNNNHVKFVTPAVTLEASHTMKVDVVLHQIATNAAESIGAEVNSGRTWIGSPSLGRIVETGVEIDSSDSESPTR